MKDLGHHRGQLPGGLTQSLLQEVGGVYHTEINDLLLCALGMTLSQWSGQEAVSVGVEGHGREEIGEAAELSRTVGWFTTMYPVLLEIRSDKGIGDVLKGVKEQLRQIPDKGVGYGVLKYINKAAALAGPSPWDIVFNYLGQIDNIVHRSEWLHGATESAGDRSSELYIPNEPLSVNSIITGGMLTINWSYSQHHYEEATIAQLSAAYVANLSALITHCITQGKKGSVYTPSDFGLGSDISYSELDHFINDQDSEKKTIMEF
jgi:non-ribosomal peptide synthase protein (TIGR01720 family)